MKSVFRKIVIASFLLVPGYLSAQEPARIYAWGKAVCATKTNHCDVVPGGSIIIPFSSKSFDLRVRFDVSGQVGGDDIDFSNSKTWNTGEVYLGLNTKPKGTRVRFALAGVYGTMYAFNPDAVLRVDKPRVYGGGIKLATDFGGYIYLMYGKNEIAGDGNRFLVTGFLPLVGSGGYGIHFDGASGSASEPRYLRFGIAVPIKLGGSKPEPPPVDDPVRPIDEE